MAELEFAALRAEVETATRQPEFTAVTRRAWRAKARDRVTTGAAVFATLGVLLPIAIVAMHGGRWRDPTTTGPASMTLPEQAPPRPISVSVRAVAGTGVDRLFAAVDVCTADAALRHCSLQVTALPLNGTPGHQSPLVIGQLRDGPADGLSEVRLVALSPRSLMLSGVPGNGSRGYLRINTSGGAADLPTTKSIVVAGSTDRPVQLRDRGEVYAVRQSDDRVGLLAHQPPISLPVLLDGVSPEHGWWVVGCDPITGETAVAVSHDWGATWTAQRLGIDRGPRSPTLVTSDGLTAYLFTAAEDGTISESRTVDGGQSWTRVPVTLPWLDRGDGRRIGAWVRSDGSVVLWRDGSPVPSYLESTDGGSTFAPTSGPDAPVVPVDDGYVAFDQQAFVSRDGRAWGLVPMPAYVPVS